MEEKKLTSKIKTNPTVMDIVKETGTLMRRVVIDDTATSWTGDPENAFYSDDAPYGKTGKPKLSRLGKIWYTPHTVVVEQKNGYHIVIPTSRVRYSLPL